MCSLMEGHQKKPLTDVAAIIQESVISICSGGGFLEGWVCTFVSVEIMD